MSFSRKAWSDAYAQFIAADQQGLLEPEDLVQFAIAAHLIGKETESSDILARAHQAFLNRGDIEPAARSAFWLGFSLLSRREMARGSGWLSRARRLVEEGGCESVVEGLLLLPVGIRCLHEGDCTKAYATFTKAVDIGERFRDTDLVSIARNGQGRALIRQGNAAEGVALLDEAMVVVTSSDVNPITVGNVYCSVLEACHEIFDLRRAQEWTAVLTTWCASQPDLVPYRGHCLVRRAEVMRLHGAWAEAMDEALRARELLSSPPNQPAVWAAIYQQGELHRLRGEFDSAEEAYRNVSQLGRRPQPGLALLRLAQGQLEAAGASIRRARDEAQDVRNRSLTLGAYIEIMLAADDVASARAAADELRAIASTLTAPYLRALSGHGLGSVLLAEGHPLAALEPLGEAWTAWCELDAPYEAARVRVLIGLAHRALGDDDTAQMEFDAARQAFEQLGAVPDCDRLQALTVTAERKGAAGLTPRELEVLGLIATGKTNRAIARSLAISEKTVARHVSNIFTKLGLSSRAAATAYAYQHDLLQQPPT